MRYNILLRRIYMEVSIWSVLIILFGIAAHQVYATANQYKTLLSTVKQSIVAADEDYQNLVSKKRELYEKLPTYIARKKKLDANRFSISYETAYSILGQLTHLHPVYNVSMRLSPMEPWRDDQASKKFYRIISSDVKITFEASSIEDISLFIDHMQSSLPGFMHLSSIDITRTRRQSPALEAALKKGLEVRVFDVEISFMWFGLVQISDTDTLTTPR